MHVVFSSMGNDSIAVIAYCIAGNERIPCEEIPVGDLAETDRQEPYTMEQIAAWRSIEGETQ